MRGGLIGRDAGNYVTKEPLEATGRTQEIGAYRGLTLVHERMAATARHKVRVTLSQHVADTVVQHELTLEQDDHLILSRVRVPGAPAARLDLCLEDRRFVRGQRDA